ncbi:hypothetical protein Ddc_19880 [Ditylenchus destructor]|nr:hypothetical protein Ddc_19880 [Ditylenchus destructor]
MLKRLLQKEADELVSTVNHYLIIGLEEIVLLVLCKEYRQFLSEPAVHQPTLDKFDKWGLTGTNSEPLLNCAACRRTILVPPLVPPTEICCCLSSALLIGQLSFNSPGLRSGNHQSRQLPRTSLRYHQFQLNSPGLHSGIAARSDFALILD